MKRTNTHNMASLAGNTFQIRRVASQTKPMEDCHPERSEGSLAGQRSFAALRMTKRDGLLFEMYCPLRVPCCGFMKENHNQCTYSKKKPTSITLTRTSAGDLAPLEADSSLKAW